MESADALRIWAEGEVVICFAGPIASRRVSRKMWRRDLKVAYHEAAHLVAAWAVGQCPYGATVIPDHNVQMQKTFILGGSAHHGTRARPQATRERAETDLRKAAAMSMLLAPETNWASALRTAQALRATAEEVVRRNWNLVVLLAAKLNQAKTLDQAAIERILPPRSIQRAPGA